MSHQSDRLGRRGHGQKDLPSGVDVLMANVSTADCVVIRAGEAGADDDAVGGGHICHENIYAGGKILLPVPSSSKTIALVGHTFAARTIFSSLSPLGSATTEMNFSSSWKTLGAACTHFPYPSHFSRTTVIFMAPPVLIFSILFGPFRPVRSRSARQPCDSLSLHPGSTAL